MDNNRKYIAISAIFFGLVFLGLIIYILFFKKDYVPPLENQEVIEQQTPQVPATLTPKEEKVPATSGDKKATINVNPIVKKEFTQADLKILASSFAERFGSFSNQADFGNIRDLKIFMSEKMIIWADAYIESEILKKTPSNIYYGITSKAVSQEVKKFDDAGGEASVLVATQRRESTGTMDNATKFSQNILLNFVKEGGAWKVDSAYWQDR